MNSKSVIIDCEGEAIVRIELSNVKQMSVFSSDELLPLVKQYENEKEINERLMTRTSDSGEKNKNIIFVRKECSFPKE